MLKELPDEKLQLISLCFIQDFKYKKLEIDKKLDEIVNKKIIQIEKDFKRNKNKNQGGFPYFNGAYAGEYNKDIMPNGNGTMIFTPSEDMYMGQFDSGLKHGLGKYTYLSRGGSAHHPFSIPYYSGEWFADSYHGLGKHLITDFENLMIYEGTHTHDKKNGFGIYRSADGKFSYEGEWENGLRHGLGIQKNSDGKISGVIYKNNKLVKQEFQIDMPDGEGTHIYPDGSKYVGNFQNGFKHGKGTLTWDGNNGKYVGDFKNGFKHGKGSYALYEEDNHLPYLYYDGEWKYEMRHGDGEEEYPDGSKYIGSYIDDKRNGQGVMIFPGTNLFFFKISGERYEGNWINDKLTLYESCQYTINDFVTLFKKGWISKEELIKIENSKVELLYGNNYHGDIIFINMRTLLPHMSS